MAFVPDPEKIRSLHRAYFDEDPTEQQRRLYDAYPHANGYSDGNRDAERFRAVLNLALVLAIPDDGVPEHVHTPFVFFPKPFERWVVDEIRKSAESLFDRLRKDRRVDAAKFVGNCFKALRLGHLVLQLPGAPDRWVAYGFTRTDPIPNWMQARLIEPT